MLRSLTKKQAKIGVAGGSFDDGQAVTLKLGKKVTLVNTATGVRYVLKLVYTGARRRSSKGSRQAPGSAGHDRSAAARRSHHDDDRQVTTRARDPRVSIGDR